MSVFGADSGIERFRFINYLTETVIYGILTKNDSAHYPYLFDHSGFQSNNADIMLHYLAQTGHAEMLGEFVASGNDILELLAYANDSLSAPDGNGKSALDLAKACGHAKNVEYLTKVLPGKPFNRSISTSTRLHAAADKPHSGKSLFTQPREERNRIAGEAMHDLVRFGCGSYSKCAGSTRNWS